MVLLTAERIFSVVVSISVCNLALSFLKQKDPVLLQLSKTSPVSRNINLAPELTWRRMGEVSFLPLE